MTVLAVLGVVALVVLGLLVAIARAFAVDEARGYVQNRVRADVEATIASLPPELREEWGEEWRAELAAVISMPLTAIHFARGLRQAAARLSHEAAPAQSQRVPFEHVLQSLFGRYLQSLRTARDANVALRVAAPEGIFGVVGITLRLITLTTPITTMLASLVIYGEVQWWITGIASIVATSRVVEIVVKAG